MEKVVMIKFMEENTCRLSDKIEILDFAGNLVI